MKQDECPNKLALLIGPCWTSEATQEALGLPTLSALKARSVGGSILALTTADGVTVYPVCQFGQHNGQIEVNPALLPMLRTLRHFGSWAVAALLQTPAPELGGYSPVEWVAFGNPSEPLAILAKAVAREWAAGDD
ncbi:hypothetical protein H5V45_09165 [Nocardioides sp. KIGAM211]|uniref:Antitoxin Xre/MbcA/ParS-like toxin-binding domain-containing protein n=1 Tax=Nocardioides luti TaxID=2761101 RepID=A0A7X0VAD9_9ACTN|nr:hypothetical protein [Nocardioides luti]MBB6627491.1 hypothetical protein [Nocardioides luti]